MNKSVKRKTGIELLRIFAILSIIILHYLNAGIGGGMNYIHGTMGVLISRTLLALSFCAVNLFMMISGFFLSTNGNRYFSKVVVLLFEAAFFRAIIYILYSVLKQENVTVSGILSAVFSFGYFIVFYSIIYLVSPLIIIGLDRLDKANSKKTISILFVLFSIIPALAAVLRSYRIFDSDWMGISTITREGNFEGYTIVQFFLCYVIGWYIRHWKTEKVNRTKVFALFCADWIALVVWGYFDWKSAYTYDNPLVILEAALLLLICKDVEFYSRTVNELATSGFTCYLVHAVFLNYIWIEKYASQSWYVMLAHVLASSVGIYLASYIIHKVYRVCFGWLENLVSPAIDGTIDLAVHPMKSE